MFIFPFYRLANNADLDLDTNDKIYTRYPNIINSILGKSITSIEEYLEILMINPPEYICEVDYNLFKNYILTGSLL